VNPSALAGPPPVALAATGAYAAPPNRLSGAPMVGPRGASFGGGASPFTDADDSPFDRLEHPEG